MPTRPATNARAAARLTLGAAAVLPVAQAVQLMPLGDARARRWLRSRGLVRDLDGAEVVIWGDVLEALRATTEPTAPQPPRVWREADI